MKRLDRIEISECEVTEFDGDRKIIAIPKEQIKEISLEYGHSEERPIVSIMIGLVTLILGVYLGLLPIFHIMKEIIFENNPGGRTGLFALAIPLLYLGMLFILKVFKNRYFLKIVTDSMTRKLSFGKGIEKTTIESFIRERSREFGYNISLNTPGNH